MGSILWFFWKENSITSESSDSFGSFDFVPLKQESHSSHVVRYFVQDKSKINGEVQSVIRVIV